MFSLQWTILMILIKEDFYLIGQFFISFSYSILKRENMKNSFEN